MDDTLAILAAFIWPLALGVWPVAFFFAGCSPCCGESSCPWLMEFERCMHYEVLGASPSTGGDCHVNPVKSLSPNGISIGLDSSFSGMHIERVQAEISVPVTVTILGGTSRTPVGQTRTERFRFNVPAVSQPPTYDIVGPPWHLEVEITVLGVESNAEQSVEPSITTDEHGQPKLVLFIKQGSLTVSHTQSVTLLPTGVQRWPGSTVSWAPGGRIQDVSQTATRVGSTTYAWTVARGQVAVSSWALGFAIQRVCNRSVPAAVFLDENTVASFLAGDQPLTLSGIEVTIGERSVACGMSPGLLGAGIALGAYPEKIYFDVDPSVSAQQDLCHSPLTVELLPSASSSLLSGSGSSPCVTHWAMRQYRGRNNKPLQLSQTVSAQPSSFWAGESLLWNLANGPYRTSFAASQGTLRIAGGEGNLPPQENFAGLILSNNVPVCRPGTNQVAVGRCVGPSEVSVPYNFSVTFELRQRDFSTAVLRPDCQTPVLLEHTHQFTGTVTMVLNVVGSTPAYRGVANHTVNFPALSGGTSPLSVGLDAWCQVPFLDPCNPLTEATGLQVGFSSFPLYADTSLSNVWSAARWCTAPLPAYEAFVSFGQTVRISKPLRYICSPWSESTLPADGGSVTRTCETTDGEVVTQTQTETATVLRSRSRLPKNIGILSPHAAQQTLLQQGRCRLYGLRSLDRFVEALPSIYAFSATQGVCVSLVPLFGDPPTESGTACAGDSSTRTSVPCDGCVPSVEIISGEDNADVRYNDAGERLGLIDVIAKRTWLGGEGVTFRVTCGNDTITQVIRRGNTVPGAVTNLTATRGPCDTVTLNWTAPHDGGSPITNYTIEYRPLGTSTWTTLVRPASTATSATVPGLLRVGYEFRVAAVNSVGTSAFVTVSVGFILGAPTSLIATRGPCDQVALSWTPPAQDACIVVASYRIEFRAFGAFSWTVFGSVAGNVATATVTGLNPALAYQFRVARIDDANTAAFSPTTQTGGTPPAPTGVVAVAGDTLATLTWEGGEDPCVTNTNHTVQFRPTTTSAWTTFGSTGSATKSATVTGLTNGVEYRFRVRAINSVGNGSYSAESNAVTPTA